MSLLDDSPYLHYILLIFMRYIRENPWLALRESQQVGDLEADALIPRLFKSRTPLDRGESVVVANRRL